MDTGTFHAYHLSCMTPISGTQIKMEDKKKKERQILKCGKICRSLGYLALVGMEKKNPNVGISFGNHVGMQRL